MQTSDVQSEMDTFTLSLEFKIGNSKVPICNPGNLTRYTISLLEMICWKKIMLYPPYGDELVDVKVKDIDELYMEELDNLIGSQVKLPDKGGIPLLVTMKKRKRDSRRQPVGRADNNPVLDSSIYELEYPDGRVEEYSVNLILENMVEQVDSNDWDATLLDEILAFRRDSNTSGMQGPDAFTTVKGRKRPVITTKGWDVQVK